MSTCVRTALCAATLLCVPTPAICGELKYTPVSPTFGGNPFNSQHLLGIANAQNKFKDPSATTSNSEADIFARQLQSRLLSALSSQIVDAIFGPNPQERGTITFGDQTIDFERGIDSVTLTIRTGDQSTTIVVPTFVTVN